MTISEKTRTFGHGSWQIPQISEETSKLLHPKMAERPPAQMNAGILESQHDISTIHCLSLIKLAVDTSDMQKVAGMWLVLFFVKNQSAAKLISTIMLRENLLQNLHKGQVLTAYCEVVSYLLEQYTPDDVIVETDGEIMRLTTPTNKT